MLRMMLRKMLRVGRWSLCSIPVSTQSSRSTGLDDHGRFPGDTACSNCSSGTSHFLRDIYSISATCSGEHGHGLCNASHLNRHLGGARALPSRRPFTHGGRRRRDSAVYVKTRYALLPKLLIAAIDLSSSKSYVREHRIGKHRDRRWSNPLQRDAMLHRSTKSDFINIVYPLKTRFVLYDCTSSPSKQPKNDATDPARTTSSDFVGDDCARGGFRQGAEESAGA